MLLQELNHNVTLFDFSEQAIKRANYIGVLSTICDNFLTYDFAEKKYDIVFVKGFSLLNTDNKGKFLSLTKRMKNILKDDGYIVYWGQTDLSGKWSDSGWFELNTEMIDNYFETYLILPAFRYQLYLPLIINKFLTSILSLFPSLPKRVTLLGLSK